MEPSDHYKQGLGSGPSGGCGPTHSNGSLPEDGLLRSVLENSDEVVKALDADGTLRYASPAFGRVFGYDPEEAVGKMNVFDHVHPDDLPQVLAAIKGALSAGGVATNRTEYRFRHADGSWCWMEGVGTYLPNDPLVGGVVVNARDVTERKEAEWALKESEERFRAQYENLPVPTYTWRRVAGDFVLVEHNDAARQFTGEHIEALLGSKATELLSERPVLLEMIGRCFTERVTLRRKMPWRMLGTGEERCFVATCVYVPPDLVMVHTEDVTEGARAEGRLRFQAQLLEAVGEAVIALDADRKVVYWNRAAEEMYGWTAEEVVGRRLMDRVVPEDLRTHAEEVMAGVRAGLSWKGEFVVRRKDGTSLTVEATNTPVLGEDGEQVGVVGVLRDVTESKAAEAALKESERHLDSVVSNAHAYAYRCLNEPGWPNEYASDYALNLTGYPPEDLLVGGKVRLGDLIVEGDRARVWDEVQEAIAEGRGFELRYALRRRDGRIRHVHEYGRGVYGADGEVVALEGLVYDVTEQKEAEEALIVAEERYRNLVERGPAMTYVHHQVPGGFSGTIYVSPQVETILGYTPEEYTSDPEFWKSIVHPEDRERVLADDERTGETGEPFDLDFRMVAKDGRAVWLRESGTLVRTEGDGTQVWQGIMLDITEIKRIEAKLQETETRYRSLVERVPVAIYRQEIEHEGAVSYISPQIEAITGYAPGEYADPTLWIRTMHPDDRQRVLDEDERTDRTGEPFRVEFRKFARDGRLIWLRDEAVLVRGADGEPLYWQGVVSDITERKALEERLEHQALHDPLTGLPNRRLFVDRLGRALKRTSRRHKLTAAVLFMDLDDFKVVNDSLGHDVGDLLLTVVPQRLGRCLRPEDALARFGGDEFVVLVEDVDDPAGAVQVAERISQELRRPFILEGRELYVAASIGISLGHARTEGPEGLLREADTAMYRAKAEGGGFRVFDPAMHERVLGRLELENDLRRAVERGEFVVHYQPIISLGTGEAWGLEALVRWAHPERGLLNPDEFVPIAEESGLVVPMGVVVLEEACRRARAWQEAHPQVPPLVVSVNISARQLARPDLADTVEGVLQRTGFEGHCLALDVTETVYVKTLEGNTGALSHLREMGVGVSIDDFGTGYASLSYLKRLPADILKIDKSFVGGLGYDIEDTAIVRMVVDLAHTLGMKVIAEGVETGEQAALLAELGCDYAQGYHFSKPLPPEGVPGFLGR